MFFDVEGIELPMTVDTGAEVSLIAEDSRKKVLPDVPLRDTNIVLRIFVIFFSHSFFFLFSSCSPISAALISLFPHNNYSVTIWSCMYK